MNNAFRMSLPVLSLLFISFNFYGQSDTAIRDEQITNAEPSHVHYIYEDERYRPIRFSPVAGLPGAFSGDFEFRQDWSDRQIFVKLGELNSPYILKINGFTFGHGGDHGGIYEFNITPFLHEEINEIALIFEDPEKSPAGIADHACALLIRDQVHIRDIQVTFYPGVSTDDILVRMNLFVRSYLSDKNKGRTLSARIIGPAGEQVGSRNQKLDHPLAFRQELEITFDQNIRKPSLWAPDHPDLYTLILQMNEKGKNGGEFIVTTFGIRNATIVDSLFVINNDTLVPKIVPWTFLEELATEKKNHANEGSEEETDLQSVYPLSGQVIDLIREKGYNAILADGPVPSPLVELLSFKGIMVIKKEADRSPYMERPDFNQPCVIWTE